MDVGDSSRLNLTTISIINGIMADKVPIKSNIPLFRKVPASVLRVKFTDSWCQQSPSRSRVTIWWKSPGLALTARIWDLKSPNTVGRGHGSGRVFGGDGFCQVAATCIWGSRASRKTLHCYAISHIPCFSLQLLSCELDLLNNIFCSWPLLTFSFNETLDLMFLPVLY